MNAVFVGKDQGQRPAWEEKGGSAEAAGWSEGGTVPAPRCQGYRWSCIQALQDVSDGMDSVVLSVLHRSALLEAWMYCKGRTMIWGPFCFNASFSVMGMCVLSVFWSKDIQYTQFLQVLKSSLALLQVN